MRDDDRRLGVARVRRADQRGHFGSRGGIESRRRLVVQDDIRIIGQRASDGQPLPLAATEGRSAHVQRHSEFSKQFPRAIGGRLRGRAATMGFGQADIGQRREFVEQRVALENDAQTAPALARRSVRTFQLDRAPGLQAFVAFAQQTGQQTQQGRFAGAAGPDDQRHLTGLERGGGVLQQHVFTGAG